MKIQKISFDDVPQFSKRDKAYTAEHEALQPFYKYEVTLDAFEKVLHHRKQYSTNRKLLVQVLEEQYELLTPSEKVQTQIGKLENKNTFTVVTAHQPSLFTGPLYFIYKIISVINLAKQLNEKYTDSYVVPVFVIGGEDHDFEEINHLHLFNKKVVWQNEASGAVGQMATDSLQSVLQEIKSVLGDSDNAKMIYSTLEACYTKHRKYGVATQAFVHELFKNDGLVVFNMNHPKLKAAFVPYIKQEVFEQPSQALIEQTQQRLSEVGFDAQATPRAINFFYLKDQIRARIVAEEEVYKVLDTDIQFTKSEMVTEIEQHPERFSPNVVMRPIYQEVILPNLAYIGGGGELAYWQERLSQFEYYKVNYPMLVRRNSVLWIDKGTINKMNKLELTLEQLFGDVEFLIKEYVKENTENELSLKHEKLKIQQIFEDVIQKAVEVDQTLKKSALSEQAKVLNALSSLESKLVRAEKNNHETKINQIRSLKDKLFPNNGLQERHDNFMGFYLKHGEDYFTTLKDHLHPLEKQFIVILEA